ncbi:hypothetical protein ACFE04_014381 [Oxalis oulophora]
MNGDSSGELEKMERELKCRICLNLFDSAISLASSCNHVFCNACIVKSMRSEGYNCPVCKLPYRRREIRPAPHMDNLVNIYKSMSIAASRLPTSNPSDEEKQIEDDPTTAGKNMDNKAENQGRSKRKPLRKRSAKSKQQTSNDTLSKPSFPAKKRVCVPQYPPLETSPLLAKVDGEILPNANDKSASSIADVGEKPGTNKMEQLALPPFFWLRDKSDEEKSSQEISVDETEYITPPNVPCFSDIKDSDDECPSPTAVSEKSARENLFDSEMFEWTQRACSPELFLTPVKAKGQNSEELQAEKLKEVVQDTTTDDLNTNRSNSLDVELGGTTSPVSEEDNDKTGTAKPKKRGRKPKKMVPRKCGKIAKDMSASEANSEKEFEIAAEQETVDGDVDFEKKKKTKFEGTTEQTPQGPILSLEEEKHNQNKNNMEKTPVLLDNDSIVDVNINVVKTRRSNRKANDGNCQNKMQPTKQKPDSSKLTSKKNSPAQVPTPMVSDNRASSLSTVTGKRTRKTKSLLSSEHGTEIKCGKKKVSFTGISNSGLLDEIQVDSLVPAKETEKTDQVQHNHCIGVLDDLATPGELPLKSGATLPKCMTLEKLQCAFCHSSEDSEPPGQMAHYHNGRSVALDFNGGTKIIHCHKECAEWAPNVYFENDTAINLEAELARSRRIKCCCCGLKGAALGCYEKSCRKSFHVPCAKMTPQCRWDSDNFVMLCPLHSSAKLPNEMSESQERMKQSSIVKHKMPIKSNQESIKNDTELTWQWKTSGSSKKPVLCCSALTDEEREVVSEFEGLSGTKVLKNWDSSVTHVIASTDENKACKRTLKVLMGTLEGKWILSIEWIKACMKAGEPVDEEQYEISIDAHGIKGGPKLGRLRIQNKQQKLFNGLNFYLMGDFKPSYKGYLQNLVVAAGGNILHRKPITRDEVTPMSGSCKISTFIIYSIEVPDKCGPSKKKTILDCNRFKAEALASSCAAKAASNSWLLNSIAASKLQSPV